MKKFTSIFPFDQSVIAEYPLLSLAELNKKSEAASKAFSHWKLTSFNHRADVLTKAASILKSRRHELAKLMSMEMGKAYQESVAEIEKCALVCNFYAENGEAFLKDETIVTTYQKSYVAYQPLGAVLAVMPWNFPFWQVFRFAAPTLMAGNVALLKHAHNVSGCSLAIEEVWRQAGAAEGVFQSLITDSEGAEKMIRTSIVQAVSLTGSETAGSAVAAIAASEIKKSVLELGGSDGFIVLADADITAAAKTAVQARMQNAGQSCIAAKRFIVETGVYDEFIGRVEEQIKNLKQGNPFQEDIDMGPLASPKFAEQLLQQLSQSTAKGAHVLVGGQASGANFQPTLVNNIHTEMPLFNEETFGPVMSVIKANNAEDAVRIANNHRYGLGNSVWTKDLQRGEAVARQLESGNVFINAMTKSDPALPFGGLKKSGFGRELSHHGIREFVNAKTITVSP